MISPSLRPLPDNTQQSKETNNHASDGNGTHNPNKQAATDRRGHWSRQPVVSESTIRTWYGE